MYLHRKDGITRLSIALWYSPMQVLVALGWLAGIAIGWWLGRP